MCFISHDEILKNRMPHIFLGRLESSLGFFLLESIYTTKMMGHH